MPTDADLLRAYHAGDPAAFAALIARHVDWAYAVAHRRTGDRHAAEDVTQAAFLALAVRRLPAASSKEANMTPWLFGVVQNLASKSARSAARRRRHEAAAATHRDAVDDRAASLPPWPTLVTALDTFITTLPRGDAEAVLLRFYERRTHAQIGAALNLTEESARKRVARAVAKLRERFFREGLTTTLEASLIAHTAPPAPAGLAAAVAGRVGGPVRRPVQRYGRPAVAAAGGGLVGLFLWVAVVTLPRRPVAPTPFAAAAPATTSPDTRPTTMTFDELIQQIRTGEQRIRTLTIRNYRTRTSAGDTPDGPWQSTPQIDIGSAWLDGRPDGKMRIDSEQSVSPWTAGVAPYYVERQSASWDGTAGRVVTFAGGPIDQPHERNVAVTTSKRPGELSYLGATGAAYLANYVDHLEIGQPATLSEAFEFSTRPLIALRIRPPTLSAEGVGGFDTVRVDWSIQGSTWTYWFARERGYALVRFEHAIRVPRPAPSALGPELRYLDRFEVKTLTEAAPGVWVPTDATTVATHLGPSKEHPWAFEQRHFEAEAIVVNDPAFNADTFRLKIPPGFREQTRK